MVPLLEQKIKADSPAQIKSLDDTYIAARHQAEVQFAQYLLYYVQRKSAAFEKRYPSYQKTL